jgi:hypothetical protein
MTWKLLTHPETGLTTAGRHATGRFLFCDGAAERKNKAV